MALSEAEYEDLHRRLWVAVQAHAAQLGETADEYIRDILSAVSAGDARLSAEAQQYLTDYLYASEAAIRTGIEAALAPLAAGMPRGMRDAFIRQQTAEAYARRWPDGLSLSRRVWRWSRETQAGVDRVLRDALQVERGTTSVLMDMQRAIEGAVGERFAAVSLPTHDWASDLYSAARAGVGPGTSEGYVAAVKAAVAQVERLRDGGTRRQAEHALAAMRKAIEAGRQDLLDEAVRWWLYDKQLYRLRRIARTEMATAHHRAVIASTIDDEVVLGYRWVLSASHPVTDICDDYARADFGMGAGVWPRERVPRAKAHPQCMCALIPTTRRMRRDGVRGEEPSARVLAHAAGVQASSRSDAQEAGRGAGAQ